MFQLIIRKSNEQSLAEFFSRGEELRVEALPYRLAGRRLAGVDAVVPQLGAAVLEFSEGDDGGVAVTVAQPGVASRRQALRHGECLEVGGVAVFFYLVRARARVSWRSAALGTLAMAGVALALAAELAAFCAVPYLMHRSDHWRRQGELQAINYQTDALRKSLRKMESTDPVAAVFLEALRTELDDRARFLRRHGERMHTTARREMLENLRQLDDLAQRLAAEPHFLLPPAELQVDAPVRNIIGTE